ncbi:putative solute carrier family 22 member 31 [Spea bombifrons]|uniref:putative solute carrier family 22 member 31 n=1 Tax=Spea bombifrons TaxID=233779 RepID=UPI00234BC0A2|nr:putative solute carrier family 22 member 31 [Spea bombifrons]
MDFDGRVWPLVGGFGRYTRLVAAASWLPNVALALGFFSELLYSAPTGYQCRGDPGVSSGPCDGNSTGPAPGNRSDNCPTGWEYDPQGWLQNNIITQWDLVCDSRWKVPLEHICNLSGWLLGYVVSGFICDRWGRRTAFILSLVLGLPLGVAMSFSPGYVSFLLLRGGFSAALAGIFLSFYIARLELCPPGHRLMVTMIGGFFWVAGELLLPGLGSLCSDWRLLQGAITGTLLLLGTYWGCHTLFPESPRWLLATQQLEPCKAKLLFFSRANGAESGEDLSGPEGLFTEIDSTCEGFPRPRYYTICSILGTRLIWKNTMILGFATFIGCGIKPCFTRNLQTLGPYITYFLQAGNELLACALLCISANHWGRRSVLLICTILTGFCSLLLLALTQYLFSGASVALSVLGSLCAHAMVMLSVFYASEVLPTVIRGSGVGLILGISMVGRAALPIIELHQKSGFFLHHVVLSSFCILLVLSLLLLPETKRKSLPETLRHGENLRRPPLLLTPSQDSVPLLAHGKTRTDYNPDSYARLASATKKMLTRDASGSKNAEARTPLSKA